MSYKFLERIVSEIEHKICEDTVEALLVGEHLHHDLGRWLRNNYSLWDTNTPLVKDFNTNFYLYHADDISSIIIEALRAKLKSESFNPWPQVKRYWKHWNQYGWEDTWIKPPYLDGTFETEWPIRLEV